uniref:Uncharacterized protein n=1 Tax=mine drainage metagenome TaxID=410659 RepID=E6PY97_9ZZZZ
MATCSYLRSISPERTPALMNRRHFLQCSTASLGLFAANTSHALTPPDKRSPFKFRLNAGIA